MGLFGGLLGGALFFAIYGLFKREKRIRFIIVNGGLITLIVIMFIIAMPDYTYEESRETVAADYLDQKNVDKVDMPALYHKTVPSDGSSSWLLYDQLYYVGIKDGQQNEIYYVVNPIQGEATRLNEPYWEEGP